MSSSHVQVSTGPLTRYVILGKLNLSVSLSSITCKLGIISVSECHRVVLKVKWDHAQHSVRHIINISSYYSWKWERMRIYLLKYNCLQGPTLLSLFGLEAFLCKSFQLYFKLGNSPETDFCFVSAVQKSPMKLSLLCGLSQWQYWFELFMSYEF